MRLHAAHRVGVTSQRHRTGPGQPVTRRCARQRGTRGVRGASVDRGM